MFEFWCVKSSRAYLLHASSFIAICIFHLIYLSLGSGFPKREVLYVILFRVTATIGEESEHLQEILMQNRNELVQLSTRAVPDETELLSEMDAVRTGLQLNLYKI